MMDIQRALRTLLSGIWATCWMLGFTQAQANQQPFIEKYVRRDLALEAVPGVDPAHAAPASSESRLDERLTLNDFDGGFNPYCGERHASNRIRRN